MTGGPGELYLVACEPLTSHGFALPLFGQRSRANTLYVAVCDPPGDHAGRISGFEVYEPSYHVWLADELHRSAAVGGPWLDVFLRDEPFATGLPADIWAALRPVLDDAAEEAPLSVLDAAIHAAAPERDRLAVAARAYVATRFGETRARRWATSLTRQTLEVGLLHAAASGEFQSLLRSLDVQADSGTGAVLLAMTGDVPPAHSQLLEPLLADVALLSVALQVEIRGPVAPDMVPSAIPAAQDEEAAEDFAAALDSFAPSGAGVLILALGRRAKAIARHFDLPGWWPEGLTPVDKDRELTIDGRSHRTGSPLPVVVLTSARAGRTTSVGGPYDVIVTLVDDPDRADGRFTENLKQILSVAAGPATVLLLAPALPEELPTSAILDAERGTLPWLDALLDTSQARSPFWWGSDRRSLDRRIADIVMGGALLALAPEIREALRARSDARPAVLAFALTPAGATAPREEVMLASESTWVRRTPERLLFSRQITLHGPSQAARGRVALVEGRIPEVHFEEFAREALGEMIGEAGPGYRVQPGAPQANPRLWPAEPPTPDLDLHSPAHAVALTLARRPEDLRLVVAAEAPQLRSIAAARSAGQFLVRYTDAETLKPLLTSPAEVPALPGEVRLDAQRSSPLNRRLATRGVDQRDVVRLTEDQLQEWLAAVPPPLHAAMMEKLRTIRPTGSTQAAGLSYAFRRRDLRDLEGEEPGAISRLRAILGLAPTDLAAPYKRQADLDIAWLPTPPGRTRFAILDGELPPVVVRLEPGQAVLQTAFIFDGDEGSPSLFRSRAFAVWGRATLSRSSSWMSRFSVGATFGGFPLPRGFNILEEEGRAVLDSGEAGPELARLATMVETVVERELARAPDASWKLAHRVGDSGPMREVNELILRLYDLAPDADDLTLLMRLSELNARL